MRQHSRETVTLVTPRAGRRWVWALLLMGLVASALSGCVVVPAGGYAYGPRPYYGRPYYYHHYDYDHDRYYYRG